MSATDIASNSSRVTQLRRGDRIHIQKLAKLIVDINRITDIVHQKAKLRFAAKFGGGTELLRLLPLGHLIGGAVEGFAQLADFVAREVRCARLPIAGSQATKPPTIAPAG